MPPESTQGPAVTVVIDAGRAPVATLIGAIDAALASELDGVGVQVALAEHDPRREPVAHLCGADPRVDIVPTDKPPSEVLITMPAHARPQPRTIPELVGLAREAGVGSVAVRVPGRLGLGGKLHLKAGGSGERRVRPAEVGLRSTTSRGEPGPSPPGDLATERAEHLRHRARSSTMRARLDRNQHQYSRERLQVRHERARTRFAEERLGRTGTAEWVRWRSRVVGRRVSALPGAARSATRSARALGRRARRGTIDRWRSRGPADGPQSPGQAAAEQE
jgi:hypothetical protein